jgi:glycosyltransferase involved in cell wall biosynthesis
MSAPRVSVVMSVYNGSGLLGQAVESLLKQSFVDFELIIIDDKSTDGSLDIISKLAQLDGRIRVIKNDINLGLTKSLNVGIRASVAEYVARMDADDISYADRLLNQVDFLDNNRDCGLVGSWAKVINERGEFIRDLKYPTDHQSVCADLIKYNPFVHSSIMMRKKILEGVGLYDEGYKYAQDYELYFRLSKTCQLANLPLFLVASRVNEGSITSRSNRKQTLCAVRARMSAIRSGLYPITSLVYLSRPIIGLIVPITMRNFVKKLIYKA